MLGFLLSLNWNELGLSVLWFGLEMVFPFLLNWWLQDVAVLIILKIAVIVIRQ